MSAYRSPPPPDPSPSERRFNHMWFTVGAVLIGAVVLALAGFLMWAFRGPTKDEVAKTDPPRRAARGERPARSRPAPPVSRPTPPPVDPAPAVPPPTEFKPREVPMGAQTVSARQQEAVTLPGFRVGEFTEPPMRVLTEIDGRERITLPSLLAITPEPYREGLPVPPPIDVLVEALRLVNPRARHTALGTRVGMIARRVAAGSPRNSRFLPRSPRVACAAFTSYILVKAGGKRHSYAVNTAYPQLRKRGGKIVAARVSTRYAGYYQWYRPGDFLFFHKGGNRLGHMEIYVGGGLTAGTSSSMLRVGIRRVGNRGFAYMTVLRL